MVAGFDECECALQRVVAGRRVRRIPIGAGRPPRNMKALPHRHEHDTRLVVGILCVLAAIDMHLPSGGSLRGDRRHERGHQNNR